MYSEMHDINTLIIKNVNTTTGYITSKPSAYYRKLSNINRPKYQNLNDFRLILQLSVPNPLQPSVKYVMKM